MLKSALSLLALTLLMTVTAFADHCDCECRNRSHLWYHINFTVDNSESSSDTDIVGPFTSVFNNQLLIIGTFETFERDCTDSELIDSGVFVTLSHPQSPGHDPCNGDSLHNHSTINLYGVNGVLIADFEGRSFLGKCNHIKFTKKSGVYADWVHPSDPCVFIDCDAPAAQWSIEGKVQLHKGHFH